MSDGKVRAPQSGQLGFYSDKEIRSVLDRLSGFDRDIDYDETDDLKMLLKDLQHGGGGTYRCLNRDGLHMQSPADELHTILKGPIQDAITWVMAVLYYLEDINPDEYGSIVPQINLIFQNFPRKQTHFPGGPARGLPHGIELWFPRNRANKKGNTAGMCSLSASRLPGILFMLLMAIGQHENIVPGKVILPGNSKKTLRDNDSWNVSRVCTNALQSCYELLLYSGKPDGFIDSEYTILDGKVEVMRAHMVRLFDMKTDLLRCKKNLPVDTSSRPSFRGHKHHLLEHLSLWIRMFGPTKNFDTQRSEKYHMKVKGIKNMIPSL